MSEELSPGQRWDAIFKVGEMYQKGEDLPRDDAEAASWYRKGAEEGSARSAVELAGMLIRGQGVTQDYAEARRLCESSAKHSYGPGAYCMGLLYWDGFGVAKDPSEAAKWFGQAADLRDTRAMRYLGEMYWKGVGVKQDKSAAYKWIFISAHSGISEAKADQEALEKEMDPTQIQKAKADAMRWVYAHGELVVRQPSK